MSRITKVSVVAVAVLLAGVVQVFASTVTYTTQSSFASATTGVMTENFDSAALGPVTGAIGGLTFTANIAGGGNLVVADTFDTTSGANYLGTDFLGNSFASQDNVTVSLPSSATAIGMYILVGGALNPGDSFTLSVTGGSALSSMTEENVLGDGTYVYFLGLTSSSAFTSATLAVTNPAGPSDGPYWNVDDITYGTAKTNTPPPVPEPSTLLLLGAGLATVVSRRKRA